MDNKEKVSPGLDNSVIEIERIVLSHAMHPRGDDVDEIFLQLQADDFSDFRNRTIFVVINSLRVDGKNTDFLSVLTYFETNPEIQFNNFKQYVTDVYALHSYQTNILQFIEIIKNNSIESKIKEFGQLLSTTKLDVISSKEKLWSLERDFLNITSNKKSKEISVLKSVLKEYQEKLNELRNFKQELTGISSGYPTIDRFTNGFQGGDLIILAARPGIGKTALAINFLVNAAKRLIEEQKELEQNQEEKAILSEKRKPGVLMFSMEMSSTQVCQRILSSLSMVNGGNFKTGGFTNYEWASVLTSIDFANSLPIYIDDTGDLSIMDIQSKIKQMSNDKDIKLVVVDYLQLLKGGTKNNQLNRQQEVTLISRSLKSIARQFNIPIIAIAQLSRKIEERRGDKKPMLSDLRESGSIEQDADLVCFLNYIVSENPDNNKNQMNQQYNNNVVPISDDVLVEFIVAKNRNGSTGSTNLMFKKDTSLYLDLLSAFNQTDEENKNKMN